MEDNNQRPLPPPAGGPQNDPKAPRKGPRFNIYWVYGIIILAILGLQFFSGAFGSAEKSITFQDFRLHYLDSGKVAKVVVVNKDYAEIYLKNTKPALGDEKRSFTMSDASPDLRVSISSAEQFEKNMNEAQENVPIDRRVGIDFVSRGSMIHDLLNTFLLPIIILAAMWFLIMRKMG